MHEKILVGIELELFGLANGKLRFDLVGNHLGNGQAAGCARRWRIAAMEHPLGQWSAALAAIKDKVIDKIAAHIERLGAHTCWSTLDIIFGDIWDVFLERLHLQVDKGRLGHLAETEANVFAGHFEETWIAQSIKELNQIYVAPAVSDQLV